MKYKRLGEKYRNPTKRVKDFKELSVPPQRRRAQVPDRSMHGLRCSLLPGRHRLPHLQHHSQVERPRLQGQWEDALNRLLMTNNFPSSPVVSAPPPVRAPVCSASPSSPSASSRFECAIIDKGFEEGWMVPQPPKVRTGKTRIIGSGPAGMAAADQLNRAGHSVTVYERADRIGGLLMYGIPNMKLDKGIVQRRVDLMAAEGVKFITSTDVGRDVDPKQLHAQNDAVIYAVGATWPRDLKIAAVRRTAFTSPWTSSRPTPSRCSTPVCRTATTSAPRVRT